jgi:putative ABC transport system ATP-binding protein
LLNVLGLLDRPTEGRYELDGVDVGALTEPDRTALRARWIGFVFQAFHLLPYRSAVENVAMSMLYGGVRRRERERLATEALVRVGLGRRIHAVPATLSGGERQRVAIARALAVCPRLLLCDEPTGNLDSASSEAVLDLVSELHTDGMTVVMITHDPLAARRASRLLVMRDGVLNRSAASVMDAGLAGAR